MIKNIVYKILGITMIAWTHFLYLYDISFAKEAERVGFTNPLTGTETFSGLLVNITTWVLGIAAFLAMLALVVGGIRLIIAFGNDQQVIAAKKNITWAIAGVIVIILSYAIIGMISTMLGVSN